eukprot:CAMPEP_0181172904 /NCGR_PEP_ID=MMETSP1096-20121128/2702_1 /TAXON_ID=156174 ORGANISM="Chrysochromulina ericina, Strain CCMP281" /NCGR_SAMPLE_ID=MMETSP1096 /ASSEMBLY_ACC=CAM_ASM_000453 /LENGTH=117 /DNA_ID=CAMNT_0023260671 /DNA_START=353 /DNA_END=706 /DNA_ORIENTATION=-
MHRGAEEHARASSLRNLKPQVGTAPDPSQQRVAELPTAHKDWDATRRLDYQPIESIGPTILREGSRVHVKGFEPTAKADCLHRVTDREQVDSALAQACLQRVEVLLSLVNLCEALRH